ncbi:MAG: radical SAM family heme chaperone HemW, partial [Flavobacteriales bacterium]
NYLKGESISTIYFGGGTPSLLHSHQIAAILSSIKANHKIENDLEFTLEANPEDLSEEKLKELKSLGINRLSLGTQSFIDSELKWMNRMHTAEEAETAIQTAQQLAFDNISIDLIFGLPDQTEADWTINLDKAISLNVQHISSYGLTIEEKTVLERNIRKGTQKPPQEKMAELFLTMNMEHFPANGFEHYETSNYAKEGFISRHNSNYWRGEKYLGLGPSAHSFNGNSREWNVKSNAAYISALAKNQPFSSKETLTITDQLNEQIMTGLRTKWGIQKSVMEQIQTGSWAKLDDVATQVDARYISIETEKISLTKQGVLLTDSLTSELFF